VIDQVKEFYNLEKEFEKKLESRLPFHYCLNKKQKKEFSP
jgi:hypothetical protein